MNPRAFVFLLLVAGAVSCRAAQFRPVPPVESAINEWIQVNRQDDAKTAYGLLAASVRARIPYSEFAAAWNETAAERHAQIAQLEAALEQQHAPTTTLAHFTLDSGQKSFAAARDLDGWRVTIPLVSSSFARTPADAIERLLAAIESQRLDAAFQVLSSARREGLRRTLVSLVEGLKAHSGKHILIGNNLALIEWTDNVAHWKVSLVREDGSWQIDDIDLRAR
ncbi:MAG: hypothetical protein V2A73_11555 [Pseudomonadota bacterium]